MKKTLTQADAKNKTLKEALESMKEEIVQNDRKITFKHLNSNNKKPYQSQLK